MRPPAAPHKHREQLKGLQAEDVEEEPVVRAGSEASEPARLQYMVANEVRWRRER